MQSRTPSAPAEVTITYRNDKDELKTLTGSLAVHAQAVSAKLVPLAVAAHNNEVEALLGWQNVARGIVASDMTFKLDGKVDFAGKSSDAKQARAAIFFAIDAGLNVERWAKMTGIKPSQHRARKLINMYMEGARKEAFASLNKGVEGTFDGTNPSYGGHLTGKLADAFKAATKLDPRARNMRGPKAPPKVTISVTGSGVNATPVAAFTSLYAILKGCDPAKLEGIATAQDRTKVRNAINASIGRLTTLAEAVAPVRSAKKAS